MAILFFHLIACSLYMIITFCNIVLQFGAIGAFTDWSPVWQFSMIGFHIVGVFTVLCAMWGVTRRIDVAVRVYLGYLLVTFALDTVALMYLFLWNDNCHVTSKMATTALVGQAFMCGFMRILSYLFVAAVICVEVYCLFIVWSFCEDVHEGVGGIGLWELLPGKEEAFQKKHEHTKGEREGPYANIVGLAYYANLPGAYPSPYGAFANSSSCSPIFGGGRSHEMDYPAY